MYTPLFGNMKHVDEPVNLMYPYRQSSLDILRHRGLKYSDAEDGIYHEDSQWEILRKSKAIIGNENQKE